ncbi:MAG: histidine phosphatase family protein [Gemmatimonadales bacterium]|nr:histidine phosphatase family protein [Gemmatimonadales bacterium]
MLLLLIRHAHAGERDPDRWPDDRDRPLTDKGRKIQRKVSRALGKLDLGPAKVLTSPWTRAVQTAEILVTELGLGTPAVQVEALADGPDLVRLADDIGDPASDASVALVGHSPWMEELAALLLAGSAAALRVDFPKSGVMGIDLEQVAQGAGELRFFLRPKMV